MSAPDTPTSEEREHVTEVQLGGEGATARERVMGRVSVRASASPSSQLLIMAADTVAPLLERVRHADRGEGLVVPALQGREVGARFDARVFVLARRELPLHEHLA